MTKTPDPIADLSSPQGVSDLYRSSLPRIYGYLLWRLAGDTVKAQELTQDVYVALLQAIERGSSIHDPVAWMLGVARNKWVDDVRRRRRWERAIPSLLVETPVELESAVGVAEIVKGLPPLQRAAVLLRYVDDLPTTEVARLLGRSVRATESLISRGRKSIALRVERD